ncbi:MAG: hypothetical protein AAB432_01935 [Patescibacteria group bacterium]
MASPQEKENGFIVLHRKMKDWQWYSDNNVRGLFTHLLKVKINLGLNKQKTLFL